MNNPSHESEKRKSRAQQIARELIAARGDYALRAKLVSHAVDNMPADVAFDFLGRLITELLDRLDAATSTRGSAFRRPATTSRK